MVQNLSPMLKLTTDKQTDRQTDKQTNRQDKNNMPPIIRSGGIIKTPPKTSITQRLRTELGWSVGVITVIQVQSGVVKPVYRYPTFPLTAKTM